MSVEAPLMRDILNGVLNSRIPFSQFGSAFQGLALTQGELDNGITPTNFGWPPGDIRRYGAAGDGVIEDTVPFQNMLKVASADGVTGYVPMGTYLIGMVFFGSNTRLLIEGGALILDTGVLVEMPGRADKLFRIDSEDALVSIDNVHIIGWGATIQLIRANYNSGEQRHCINIAGNVNNICVEGIACIDAGGDGIYVGGVGGGVTLTPDNIQIIGCVGDNNRRNGLSITAGRNVKIDGSIWANSNGTSPQKGVDIEPDQDGSGNMVGDLRDISLTNCYSTGNLGAGFSYVNPYLLNGKIVTITHINCVSVSDNTNFAMESALNHDENAIAIWRDCSGFSAQSNGFDHFGSSTRTLIDGMTIYNANQGAFSNPRNGSSYSFYSVNGTNGSSYGNVTVRNSFAYGTSALKAVTQQILGEAASTFSNMDIEVHTDAAATQRVFYDLTASQIIGKNRVVFADETELATTSNIGSSSMPAYLNNIITNTGASGTVVLGLSDTISRLPGTRVKGRVKAAQIMIFDPGSGWTIDGGQELWSNALGTEVTLEADATASRWRIIEGGQGWNPTPVALANSATPSVAGIYICQSGGTTTITNFIDGCPYQKFTFLAEHAVTITDGTNIFLQGSANFAMNVSDTLTLIQKSDGKWYEVGRSDNT